MPRSRNKYSRAALRQRTRRRRPQRSNRWFIVTISAIVLAGIVGIVVARGGGEASATAPRAATRTAAGDHWHAALGVNVCGEWLPPPATFETAAGNAGVRVGIHTHGDGFIHIHPFYRAEAGDNATFGRFLKYGGWSASRDSFDVWQGPSFDPTKTNWSNGDLCPNAAGEAKKGKPGRVVFEVNCKTVDENPSDHKLADQEVVALGFLPKGEEMGAPPNADSAPSNDGSEAAAINQKGCRPTAQNNPGVAPTTPTTAPGTTTPTG